jgi:hypothetical protein
MSKRHIANLELTRSRASSDDIITLCGRTSRVRKDFTRDLVIAWWYGGDICRKCLAIDATNTPYGQVIRG